MEQTLLEQKNSSSSNKPILSFPTTVHLWSGYFIFMRCVYFTLICLITVNFIYGQSRFFIFTEGWKTSMIQEYESNYLSIGTGFTGLPDNHSFIQFYEIDKQGNFIDSRIYQMDSTIVTEIRNQQSLNQYNEDIVMGITVRTNEDLLKARRLRFNKDLTVVTDSSWQYTSPQGNESIMYITHREQANTIIHGLNYYDGSTVKSTLLATDTLGNLIWESNFGCGAYCWMEPRHIHSAHDGGYIMTHTEQRNSNNGPGIDDHDVVNIIKTDSLGVEQWRIRPGGLGDPYTSEHIVLQPTDDGNYLCIWTDNKMKTTNVGHYNLNPDATMWLAKIAPDGNKIWEKTLQQQIDDWNIDATAYVMRQMIRTSDDNFIVAGADKLFKINQEGDIIWARHYNPLNLEFSYEQVYYYGIYGINETSDGGFIMTGEFQAWEGTDFPEFVQTGFVLKVDEYGCLEEDCQEDDPVVSVVSPQFSVKQMSIYPNPAQESVTLSYDVGQPAGRVSFVVTDVMGQVVHEQVLADVVGSVQVDTQAWASGVYLCRLVVDGAVGGVRRVVITR